MGSNYTRMFKRDYDELYIRHEELTAEYKSAKVELSWYKTEYFTAAATLTKQENEIAELKKEVARLNAKLNLDSNNSGIPVSKTPIDKEKRIPNSRHKSSRKKGGQKGHKKAALKPFSEEEVTEVVEHKAEECPQCGGKVADTGEYTVKHETEYVFTVRKIEHRFHEYVCESCGQKSHEEIPNRLKEANQYGANLQSLAVALMNIGNVPINKVSRIINGLSQGQIDMSEGYIAKLQKRFANRLEGFTHDLKKACSELKTLYWDDTVIAVSTNRACLRFYGDEHHALYTAHMHKDKAGLDEDGLLAALPPDTVVMHDHNIINYNSDYSFKNADCCVHLLRDIAKISELSKHSWCESMRTLITEANDKRKELICDGKEHFDEEYTSEFFRRYNSILTKAVEACNADSDRYYHKDERKLIIRFREYKDNYFAWVTDFKIPFSNNLSERSLRAVKSKMKVSGQFESIANAQNYATIRSYIETCRRNGVDEIDALVRVAMGEALSLRNVLRGL